MRSAVEPGDQDTGLPDVIGRRFSTAVVLFHTALAEELGLNLTDYKCLELLMRRATATPGQLSADAGLSSATTTLVLDRLEKKGLVSRAPDPHDRRRTILHVSLTPELIARFERATRGMRSGMLGLVNSFSEAEQAVIRRYLAGATHILDDSLRDLRSGKLNSTDR